MFKKLIKGIFFLSLLLFLVALIAPSFINWNEHRDILLSQISRYIKEDVSINVSGNVDFKILPRPALFLSDIDIIENNKKTTLMHLSSVSAVVKLKPLLEGRIEFYSLDLTRPILKFRADINGNINDLNFIKETSSKNIAGSAHLIQLNEVNIKDASIMYENTHKDFSYSIDNINLKIFADNISGPYSISGNALYNNANLNLDIKTGKYEKDRPVTLNLTATAKDSGSNFPIVKYSGILDMGESLALQGQLTIEDGKIYSLIMGNNLNNVTFLHDKIKLQSLVYANKDKLEFNDIKASADNNISYSGNLLIDLTKEKYNFITADINANNLTVTNRVLNSFIYPPKTFRGDISLTGRNIVLAGRNLTRADIKLSFKPNLWNIKSANLSMRGNSNLTLNTKLRPNLNNVYNIKLKSEDFARFLTNLPVSNDNPLVKLAGNDLIKSLNATASVIASSGDIVQINNLNADFSNINAKGNINISKNNIKGDLDIGSINIDNNKDNLAKLATLIANIKTDLDIKAKNIIRNEVTLPSLSFKLIGENNKLNIQEFNANLKDEDVFKGEVEFNFANLALNDFNIDINLPSKNSDEIAKFFNFKIPMLSILKNSANIIGKFSGNAQEVNFDLSGNPNKDKISIKGVSKDKGNNYTADINIDATSNIGALLKPLSIPVNSFITKKGNLNLTGKISGNDTTYQISDIKGKIGENAFSGSVNRKSGKTTANITLDNLDINEFIKSDLAGNLNKNIEVNLKATKNSWEGDLTANIKKSDDNSRAVIKGYIRNTNLDSIARASGISNNLYISKGDIEFELVKSTGKIIGNTTIKTPNLEIPQLNYNKLGVLLNDYNSVPNDLEQQIIDELNKGKIEFKDVIVKLIIDGNRINLKDSLEHVSENGTLQISEAGVNLTNKDYKIVTIFDVAKPKDLPKFKIEYTKGKHNLVGENELKLFIKNNNPPPVEIFGDVSVTPRPVEAFEPVFEAEPVSPLEPNIPPEIETIGGILKRLGE